MRLGFLLAAVIAVVVGIMSLTRYWGSKEVAEKAAMEFASELNWDVTGLSCAKSDSDGDGYIACTIAIKGDGERQIECDSGGFRGFWAGGCRMRLVNISAEG